MATRTIRGQVDASGSKSLGTGFTARRNDTGDYTVTYTNDFDESPIVLVSVAHPDGGARVLDINKSNEDHFTVIIRNNNGKLRDAPFNFYSSDEYIA